VYDALRTNLPRELMAFHSFPWSRSFSGDDRRFPGHAEVRAYLHSFAEAFSLLPLVRFRTRLQAAAAVRGGWELTLEPPDAAPPETLTVDCLCVCNGHYSEPRSPPVPGLAALAAARPGLVTHSHTYRKPEEWRGRSVLVVGGAASGEDLARELAPLARRVLWSAAQHGGASARGALHARPALRSVSAAGVFAFADGSEARDVDAVLLCTGYHFSFPFLSPAVRGQLGLGDNCVAALHEHLFAPHLPLPPLFFIGLPWKVVPFPLCELQCRWAARLLSGAAPPPGARAAAEGREALAARLRAGMPRRHAHALSVEEQFDYADRLADAAGCERLPAWRRAMYIANGLNKRAQPESYRDAWGAADECLRERGLEQGGAAEQTAGVLRGHER